LELISLRNIDVHPTQYLGVMTFLKSTREFEKLEFYSNMFYFVDYLVIEMHGLDEIQCSQGKSLHGL
jgi:hypothetical protein